MNQSQQIFHNFVMKRVQPGNEVAIEAIMAESFQRQDDGTFDAEYMGQVVPKMIALLKPECVDEFTTAAAHMRGQLGEAK